MSIQVKEILSACESSRKVVLFEPFLEHFSDIDYACVLSEICVQSGEALKRDPNGGGWFRRTYEMWETLTGVSSSHARRVCINLAEQKYIRLEIRDRVSHFRAVPESIARLVALAPQVDARGRISLGVCPECGNHVVEGNRFYYCVSWGTAAESCKFCLWKDTLSRNGKAIITVEEAQALLAGKEIQLHNLISHKTQKLFTCKGILHKRDTGRYGIKYVFPKSRNRKASTKCPSTQTSQ